MNIPAAAPVLAKLDDALGKGELNPVKKWWWDLELDAGGAYMPAKAPVNARALQKDLVLRYADQTLAVYPAPLAPPPAPYPYPMDREAGIAAYRAMIPAQTYRDHLAAGTVDRVAHVTRPATDSPVIALLVSKVERMTDAITRYELRAREGGDLPEWQAGAHLDIVVAPEFLRRYSLCGDPADRSCYQIAVLREEGGRGGSKLMQRIFTQGRPVFAARPVNHFPLVAGTAHSLLMGGGIGITPMIAMAHSLHAQGQGFALHYSGRSRVTMGFLEDIAGFDWAPHAHVHIMEEGTRADLAAVTARQPHGTRVYICGAASYMAAVQAAAQTASIPEDHVHLEYFTVPEVPD
jgi:ferredoxin-NADP reductase